MYSSPFRHLAFRCAIAAAILSWTTAAAPVHERVEYWIINGPEYQQVSAAVFDDERSSCMRIVRRHYPAEHVTQWHCYL